ncbi:TPA: TetR/AcrR family transcriptional regulator, partial [Enterococcus faecium]
LLNHAYFYALSEVAVHSQNKEEVKLNASLISQFFNEGWRKIRGL